MDSLAEGSKSYHDEVYIYERFAEAEDTPRYVERYLRPLVKGKICLDLGCGTGKYTALFADQATQYHALDISKDALKYTERKVGNLTNVSTYHTSAESIPLQDNSVDIVISTWVLGTIQEIERRDRVMSEIRRVLRPGGKVYLIENDIGGEFEKVRGRFPDTKRTEEYNSYLEDNGFRKRKKFNSYFQFDSKKEARSIFSRIWGENVGAQVSGERIEHRIIIFEIKG